VASDFLGEAFNVLEPRDIGLDRKRSSAGEPCCARGLLDFRQGSGDGDNIGSGTSEADREGFADPSTSAGHERYFSGKWHDSQCERNRTLIPT
jgi:hypothetical protein